MFNLSEIIHTDTESIIPQIQGGGRTFCKFPKISPRRFTKREFSCRIGGNYDDPRNTLGIDCRGGRLCPPTESSAFSEICGESAIFIGPTESSAPAGICEIRAAPHHKIGNEKEQADWLALWLVFDQIARSTLLERRHLVQTYTWRGVPSTIALTRLTLGFHARFARL